MLKNICGCKVVEGQVCKFGPHTDDDDDDEYYFDDSEGDKLCEYITPLKRTCDGPDEEDEKNCLLQKLHFMAVDDKDDIPNNKRIDLKYGAKFQKYEPWHRYLQNNQGNKVHER